MPCTTGAVAVRAYALIYSSCMLRFAVATASLAPVIPFATVVTVNTVREHYSVLAFGATTV
jgi:hypothetical protein